MTQGQILSTDPLFAEEAQEVFTVGARVFLLDATPDLGEGAEGTYVGHLRERVAVVDWDTNAETPYRASVSFRYVRNLYR